MSLHRLPEFALERYFARWEFAVRHVLCASDIEGWRMQELLGLADDESRRLWENLTLGYTESAGLPLLRAEIANLYATMSPEDVLTFAGAEEAIFVGLHAMLSPGDHAVVVVPAYQSLYELARAAGAEVTLVPLDSRDWTLDVDALRKAMTNRTRLIIINFPHNPTGAMISRDQLNGVCRLAEEHGARLFSDEVYRGLEYDDARRLPAAVDLSPRAVSMGVMSKTYGLGGVRVGWLATSDATLRSRLMALKDYTTICNAAPSEILSLIALRASDRVIARSLAIVRENLLLAESFFSRHSDRFEWTAPRAGSTAFPRLRYESANAFAEALVQDQGVLLLPGSLFGADAGYFRLGLGRTDMQRALQRLEQFMSQTARVDSSANRVEVALP